MATAGLPVVEVDRTVTRGGTLTLGGHNVQLPSHLIGKQVTLRLDGYLMHVICQGLLALTLPAPVPPDRRAKLSGARISDQPLPPPPAQPPRAHRHVPTTGEFMIAGQKIRLSRSHAGKTVTIVIEDTHFRVLHNDIELKLVARNNNGTVTRFHPSTRTQPKDQN